MSKELIHVVHSSHLDLFWIGNQQECLDIGADILNDAVQHASADPGIYFLIDTVRFLEYYLYKYPENRAKVIRLFQNGQLEIGASYTDRLENHHEGEDLVRNVVYGKRMLKALTGEDTVIAYHPDLPGVAEQSPQIYKKSGVDYYLYSRGFERGARYRWSALDGTCMIAYNFPVHYGYFNPETQIVPYIGEIKQAIHSDHVLLSFSAGDMGPFDTFLWREESGFRRVRLSEALEQLNRKYPQYRFQFSGTVPILKKMDQAGLPERSGESPSRWGTYGSATNVELFQLDKKISSRLLDAEKWSAICHLLDIPVNEPVFQRHPLQHTGSSMGTRKYFELRMHPSAMTEWLDFAWRLQLVTQDHNYGGVDGVQSNFDRYRYKEAAMQIAETMEREALTALMSRLDAPENALVVFNSMSWERKETVPVDIRAFGLKADKSYAAVASDGTSCPLVITGTTGHFVAKVPSFGYETFQIVEQPQEAGAKAGGHVRTVSDRLVVSNAYYEISIHAEHGYITEIRDVEHDRQLVKGPFMAFSAYEDDSDDVAEKQADKKLVDSTLHKPSRITVMEDNALWTKVMVTTELCECKTRLEVVLHHTTKQIDIRPHIVWCGQPFTQVRLHLPFEEQYKTIHYHVPYGVQTWGNYLEGAEPYNQDELSLELFHGYREVMGGFYVEDGTFGIGIVTDQSSFSFNHNNIEAVLIRNTKSCGDHDVMMPNYGKLSWTFTMTSYKGGWEENQRYLKVWEHKFPLRAMRKSSAAAEQPALPAAHSWLALQAPGVMTVFKRAHGEEGAYILRMVNAVSQETPVALQTDMPTETMEQCDLLEKTSAEQALDTLQGYEIKTVKITRKG